MPISATGKPGFTSFCRSAEHGFTLVEMMVVVAIIGIASSAVVLTMPSGQSKLTDEAEHFAARALAARDDAILQSRDTGVWVTPDGYGMERKRRGVWQPVTGKPFGAVRWSRGTSALTGPTGRMRATFDTTGAASAPVTVTLVRDVARASVTIAEDGSIRVGS